MAQEGLCYSRRSEEVVEVQILHKIHKVSELIRSDMKNSSKKEKIHRTDESSTKDGKKIPSKQKFIKFEK